MNFDPHDKSSRIFFIPTIEHFSATITSKRKNNSSMEFNNCSPRYYLTPFFGNHYSDTVFNFPFLFDQDGQPWLDANLYLYSICEESFIGKSTKSIRKKASQLLDYKMWVENSRFGLFDFNGRSTQRVTYNYFLYLKNTEISEGNVNSRTNSVYYFYEFLSRQPHINLDINLVDQTRKVDLYFTGNNGNSIKKQVTQRSQTLKAVKSGMADPGFVFDDGEKLRPLRDKELNLLLDTTDSSAFHVDERLILDFALETAARKQTIFTIRIKHLEKFKETNLKGGAYELAVGPGTGIDTKNDKKMKLYIPEYIAERLKTYAASEVAMKRRESYKLDSRNAFREGDIYLFLSERGQPHYAAKNDPRHYIDLNPPMGGKANQIIKKILQRIPGGEISKDIEFHWLRATSAFLYYINVVIPLLQAGLILPGEDISLVQKRLGHKDRSTTEGYLKLFLNINKRKLAQKNYEEELFGSVLARKRYN